jgi:hypothetical protein
MELYELQEKLVEAGFTDPAPSDLEWHVLYVKTMQEIVAKLDSLEHHPAASDGEDLTDYVETLNSLLGFRPNTHPLIIDYVNGKI